MKKIKSNKNFVPVEILAEILVLMVMFNDFMTLSKKYTRGKLGDATKKMAPTGERGNWYGNYTHFMYNSNYWFLRGGDYASISHAGVFYFDSLSGGASSNISTHTVISNLN